jgi:hypothetical protein
LVGDYSTLDKKNSPLDQEGRGVRRQKMEGRQDYSQLAEVVLHGLEPGHSFVFFFFFFFFFGTGLVCWFKNNKEFQQEHGWLNLLSDASALD